MEGKAFELTSRMLMGEELTDDEKKYLTERNLKYELVRYLIMEHRCYNDGPELTNFHFTPGNEFDNMSALEVANAIINKVW